MKNALFIALFLCFSSSIFGQVAKGSGVFYFNGTPSLAVNVCYDGEIGIDTTTGYWWEFSRDLNTWILAGFRVQLYDTCAAPTYTPVDKQSEVTLNSCDSLYRWRDGSWHLLNPVSIDNSITNELQTYAHSGTTSYTNTLSLGGGSFTIQGSGIVSIAHSSGTVTISATEVDGSTSNELQTLANTSDATSHTVTLSNSGGSLQLVEGANITLTTSGTGLNGIVTIAASSGTGTDLSFTGTSSPVTLNSSSGNDVTFTQAGIVTLTATSGNLTISATEVDGSTSNELQTYAHSGTTSYTNTLSNGGGSFTLQASGIVSISHTTGTVTISATEVDGSTSNELQTYAHSGTTSYTNTLSNGGGSFTLQASGIVSISHSAGTVTISATEVDGSTSNELQTLANTSDATSHTVTLSNSGGSVQMVEGSGITLTTSGTTLNGIVTVAAVDASTSNELQTYAHSGTTSYTNTLSNGGGSFTLQASGIVSISHTTGTVTISATEVDGSTSNELQTLANTSDATSHTVTLSNSGGSLQLVEGSNVTLTTSGTGLNGIVTIAATSIGTDLTFSGTSSPVTLNSSTGTDVTFTQGGIVTLTATSGNLTISATEVDGSTSNELQTYAHSGTTSYTNTLSNGGGSFTLQASGIVSISHTTGTVTISATEIDGSTSNELQTLANTSDATSHTVTLSNSGGSLQLVEGSNVTLTTSGTGLNGIVTIASTEVDGSTSNELQTYAHSGTTSYTNTLSNGGGSFTLQASGIVSISHTTGTVTISATEVDGSTSNELQTLANTSDATSHTVTLSNSGGSLQLVEGANITLTTSGTGLNGIVTIAASSGTGTDLSFTGTSSPVTLNSSSGNDVTFTQGGIVTLTATSGNLTISATEVDGSTSNELQTYAHSGTTSYTNTLSNGGGSFTLQASGIVSISHTTGTVTISATEVDGSTSNELQTLANTSDATSHTATLSNSGGSLQLVEGSNVTLTTSGTGLNGIVTIASTEVDGSTSNELQTYAHSGTTSYTNTLSLGGGSFTLQASGIASISHSAGTVTISATEVDGSTSNELQTYAHSGTTSYTNTLSNGGGSFTLQASGIVSISHTTGTVTISATEVDGSTSNELQTLANTSDATSHTVTLSNSGGSVQMVEGSGITLATTGTSLNGIVTITAVDASTSNELQTYAHSGTTSYTNTLSNSGGSFTLQASGIASISHSAGTVTISATEVDGSTSNELQTLANTSDATSHTVTLSNSGGSLQLVEGSNVTLTTSGTGLNGIVTIASTEVDGSTSNELQTYAHSGTTSYTNTLSLGGGSFTLQASGIASISHSAGTVTISATEVDGSTSNELQTYAHSGTTSYTNTLSNGGGSFTLQASGIVSISHTTGTVTISATEVDGSTSNELQTLANTSDATSHTVTLSNSGGSLQLVEGSNVTLTTSGTGLNGIVTIASTEVDGSTSNELQTYAHSGTTSYTNTLSLGGGSFTLQASGIVSISHTTGTVTISATEVDGSTSNELQTLANTSDATSHTVTLSNSGGSVQMVEGSGITLATTGTSLNGIVTITAVDASTSNELQTYAHSGTTSYTNTLSNGGGSFTLQASGIVSISNSSGTVTISATEVDGSTSNELQTLANTSDATSHTVTLSNSGGSVQLVEGSGVTLTTSGTSLNGIVTVAAVDASTSNELQTYAHSGTTSYTNTLSSGGGSFTLQASGIVSLSHSAGTTTISATEVDGSISNELQTLANTSDATSHTVTLSNSGGSVQLVEGSGITLTTSGTGLNGIVTIAATASGLNGIYGNGTAGSGSNTLPPGGSTVTIPGQNQPLAFSIDASSGGAWTGLRVVTDYSADDAYSYYLKAKAPIDSFYIAAFNNATQMYAEGGDMNIYTTKNLNFLTTSGATGKTVFNTPSLEVAGSGSFFTPFVLNAYATSQSSGVVYGQISNILTSATTVFSLNQDNTVNTIRAGLRRYGSTHATRANEFEIFNTQSAPITFTTNNIVRAGIANTGYSYFLSRLAAGVSDPTTIHTTLQSAGSIATAYLETGSGITVDISHRTVVYTGTANATFTLPVPSTCACAGREYIIHHSGTAGTLTLSQTITKGNGGTFNTLTAGQWSYLIYTSSSVRGYKITSL